jgi:copper chaperone CopZ
MQRRRFIQFASLAAGASGLAALEKAAAAEQRKTVILMVKGFSCVTCAVGLDTMLTREKGIVSSHSTYPEGKATVCYRADLINEDAICGLISDMGFSVASKHDA